MEGETDTPPATPPANPTGTPPPAAEVVINGNVTEATANLERELAIERQRLKDREMSIAQLQDENRQLRQVGLKPAPQAKPAKGKAPLFSTVLDDDDED